jgi:predicted metal-binding membrane protein
MIASVCIIALAGLGWACLAVLTTTAGADGYLGILNTICRPASFGAAPEGAWGASDLLLVWLMWCAMALAMMLPTAGPMILTYAEIADTAARKGERVISPFMLAAGYASVWLGFALAAALLQTSLARAELSDPGMGPAGALLSGTSFLAAGLYQFSPLKQACLAVCQRPFPFFFANWTNRRSGVFRLGLHQGLHCLGCCWALMLVMLGVGVMNVVWMAGLGLIMATEKMTATPRFSRFIGILFVGIGIAFIAASLREHRFASLI